MIATTSMLQFPAFAADDTLERARLLSSQDPQAAVDLLEPAIASLIGDESLVSLPEPRRETLFAMLEMHATIQRNLGQFDSASRSATRLANLAGVMADPVRKATAAFLAGTIAAEHGELAEALEAFHSADALLQATDATGDKAQVTNALAVVHTFIEDYDNARQYYERALRLARLAEDTTMEGSILGNLALVTAQLDGAEAGLAAYERALGFARELGNDALTAQQLANMCNLMVELDRLAQAESICRNAIDQTAASGQRRLNAGARLSLGNLYLAQENLTRARDQYLQLLQWLRGEIPSVQEPLLEKLVEVFEKMGEHEGALNFLRQLAEFRQQRREKQRQESIDELEMQYRVRQRDKEIEMLHLDAELSDMRMAGQNLLLGAAVVVIGLLLLLIGVGWVGYRLKARLEQDISNRNDELEKAMATISHLASTDDLTGLLNRRAFLEHAQREIERKRRHDRPLTLVMADIDHFKQINDRHGHFAGDEVLKSIAKQLEDGFRNVDVLCRWGGEEFVFLLPETSVRQAERIVERIRRKLAATSFQVADQKLRITLTFGIVALCDSIEEAIEAADEAMYRGKQKGRDRIVVTDPG